MTEQSVVIDNLTVSNLFTGLLVYILVTSVIALVRAPRYPTSIPWVGHGKGWVAGFRNFLNAIPRMRGWAEEGYEKYSKNDKSYVLPGGLGMQTEIVVPRSQMKWMLDQPDSVLSTHDAHFDVLHGEYSFVERSVLDDAYHERVIYKSLARHLNALIPDLSEEVKYVIDRAFGTDTQEWKKFNIMSTLFDVIPKLTNRMLVGKDLCRNQDYIRCCVAFTNDVIRNSLLFALMPKSVKKVVGPIASLPAKWHFRQTAKYTYPVIEQRLEDIRRKDAGENKEWEEPNDYISWHIRTAQSDGDPYQMTKKRIAQGLLPINFASIHTTCLTLHGTLLDLTSTDPKLGVLEALREEAERIYTEEGNGWTKVGLSRMYKTDSAIRESMRLNSIGNTMVLRKVIVPEGITNPEEGWHAPFGTYLSCPLHGVSTDPDLHLDAIKYDPFRYSREREEYEARSAEDKNAKEGLRLRATGLVTMSEQHFPFGHGRHTCPGRFFVAHELKMALAHLLMNYEVKYINPRPQTKWIGRNQIPPMDACIEVRRRADTA